MCGLVYCTLLCAGDGVDVASWHPTAQTHNVFWRVTVNTEGSSHTVQLSRHAGQSVVQVQRCKYQLSVCLSVYLSVTQTDICVQQSRQACNTTVCIRTILYITWWLARRSFRCDYLNLHQCITPSCTSRGGLLDVPFSGVIEDRQILNCIWQMKHRWIGLDIIWDTTDFCMKLLKAECKVNQQEGEKNSNATWVGKWWWLCCTETGSWGQRGI